SCVRRRVRRSMWRCATTAPAWCAPASRSTDLEAHRVVTLGAVRRDGLGPLGLDDPVAVDGAHGRPVLAGRSRVPTEAPLPPRVVGGHTRQLAFLPLAVVDAYLDPRNATVDRPGDA